MRRDVREVIADWLILLGALILLAALFLPWSHQLSPGFEDYLKPTGVLRGVPVYATAWQVYSLTDVALALLVALLILVAMLGGRIRRLVALVGAVVAVAFAVHALSAPPTNGTVISAPVANHPTPGRGETVALVGLGMAIAGLGLSFTAE